MVNINGHMKGKGIRWIRGKGYQEGGWRREVEGGEEWDRVRDRRRNLIDLNVYSLSWFQLPNIHPLIKIPSVPDRSAPHFSLQTASSFSPVSSFFSLPFPPLFFFLRILGYSCRWWGRASRYILTSNHDRTQCHHHYHNILFPHLQLLPPLLLLLLLRHHLYYLNNLSWFCSWSWSWSGLHLHSHYTSQCYCIHSSIGNCRWSVCDNCTHQFYWTPTFLWPYLCYPYLSITHSASFHCYPFLPFTTHSACSPHPSISYSTLLLYLFSLILTLLQFTPFLFSASSLKLNFKCRG